MIDVVVQFYPWFNFFCHLYFIIITHNHIQKQREIKFKPRIKLDHNIDTKVVDISPVNRGGGFTWVRCEFMKQLGC